MRCAPAGAASMLQAAAAIAFESLRIVAPAAPGGGWDRTARALQEAIRAEGLADVVQVENIAGAAGTVTLRRVTPLARLTRFQLAPAVIGLILGPMAEQHFRRALAIGQGDPTGVLTRPGSAALLLLAAGVLVAPVLRRRRSTDQQKI